jgi:hypothetical protein
MKKILTILPSFVLLANVSYAQKSVWDIPTMEVQISHNYSEFDKQTKLRNNQTLSTATQTTARNQGNEFKEKVKSIHARLISLSVLISDGKLLLDSYDIVKDILNYQKQIIATVGSDPKLIPVVITSQKNLVDRSQGLIKYIQLMVLSASDVNAMKSTDRRACTTYIINELRVIRGDAYTINQSLTWAKEGNYINTINPWANYVNEDKKLAQDILDNLKF